MYGNFRYFPYTSNHGYEFQLMSFDDFSPLCIACKNFDLMISNTCKLGLNTDKSRTSCDKHEPV